VKLNTLKVPLGKSPLPQGKSVAAPARPLPIAAHSVRPAVAHKIAGEERRGSQRVLLRVHASVHVALQGKELTIDATTLSVSNHGALMLMKQTIPSDARLVLEHSMTKQRIACKIARPAREVPEGFHIPLEFDSPAPNFWGIAFPPTDWRPPDDL
jgi:hypothetical protein